MAKAKAKQKKKISSSVTKRFKITKTGKVMRGNQFSGHLKLHKSKSRIRRGKEPSQLVGAFAKRIKRMLGAA